MNPHYQYHVFFCTNRRAPGETCCAGHGADDLRTYAKDRIKALGLNKPGAVRINSAGCMERCDEGPVLVVYPQGVWYTFVDREDIDEIIDRHLVKGEIVERLKI
jgi:(2Fe-2S) ferredoxin